MNYNRFKFSILIIVSFVFFNPILAQTFTDEIIGGNSPDDFSNFSNNLPNASFTGDGAYSIDLGTVRAGGGLDFPLVLTYNTSRIKVGASSGHVGLGWDLNIGEVVRSVACLPDEQSNAWFAGSNPLMDMGDITLGNNKLAYTLEDNGVIFSGDVLSEGNEFDDWDNYNISTPYDSKTLSPIRKGNNAEYYFLERPYSSWYVDYTADDLGTSSILQFQMIDENGRTFLFDKPHNIHIDKDGDGLKTSNDYYSGGSGSDPFLFVSFPTSWKLTRIDSPLSDHYVSYTYGEYARVASSTVPYSLPATQFDNNMSFCGKSVYDEFESAHISYDESVIEEIETVSHIVEFVYEQDQSKDVGNVNGTTIERKRLATIYFKQKITGQVYKEINFNYVLGQSPRHTTYWKDVSLLDHIKIKDLENSGKDEYYTFSYYRDSNFDYEAQFFGYVKKFNYLDIITLPTGGKIDFDYEDRKYNYFYETGTSLNSIQQKYTSNTNNGGIGYRAGSRVSKVTLKGLGGNNPDVIRDYEYGDGIRIESRLQDILQPSSFPLDWGFDYAKSIMSHVGHRWVEIVDSKGGYTKNYYTSGISHISLHPSFCSGTTNCPTDITAEEAKSIYFEVNPFHSGGQSLNDPSLIPTVNYAYDTYPEIYGKVYKSETGYYSDYPINSEINRVVSQSSESKWNFVESEFKYPDYNYSDLLNVQQSIFVYNYHIKNITDGKKTHTYYTNFFRYGGCGEAYDYRFREDELNFMGSPLAKVVMNDDYDIFYSGFSDFDGPYSIDDPDYLEHVNSAFIERRYTFSEEFSADVCWNNNLNTDVLKALIRDESAYVLNGTTSDYSLIKNIYKQLLHPSSPTVNFPSYPLVYVPYLQSSHENPFYSGWYTRWDDSDGIFRPRETWVLEELDEAGTCQGGFAMFCDIDDYGRIDGKYEKFDILNNITQMSDNLGIKTVYDRAVDGSLIGVFKNASEEEVFSHSFAYEGLNGWQQNDIGGDGDIEFSVFDGKLKVENLSGPNERDYIGYDIGAEISGSVIWEFDLKIPESNGIDFQMNAGGSSWNFYSSNLANETAIWSAINNETWKVFNASSWVTLKTGLVVGKTYHFKIVMHTNTNTADYYLNGEELMSGVSFRFGSSGIQKITYGMEGSGSINTEWLIDNVRVYPADAQATTQELGVNSKPLAIKGVDGATERFEYDGHSRLSSYINKNGSFASAYDYNFTSTYNTSTDELDYSYLTPNNIEGRSFANFGPDDYLESRSDFLKFDVYPKIISFGDVNALDSPSAFSVSLWFKRVADHNGGYSGGAGSEATVHNINNVLIAQSSSSSNDNLEIGTQGSNIEVYLDTQISDTYRTYNAGIVNDQWYHLALTYSSSADQAKLYLDGELVKTWTEWGGSLDNSGSSPLSLGMARPNDQQWGAFEGEMSNARVYGYTLTDGEVRQLSLQTRGVSYFDGIGRPIQSHSISAGENIVSGQLYDSRGLQNVASRPASVSSSGYITDFFGSTFTPGSALPGNSPIEDYYDPLVDAGDEDYAYSYTKYEQSMTNRVLETTLPGYDHRFGSGNENVISYSGNTVAISTSYKTWAIGELFKTVSQDPSGKQKISYTDYEGRTVVSGVDMDNNGELYGSSDLITKFKYDYNGNLIHVEDPLGLETTYTYNAIGELLEKKLPDQDHKNEYCYDDIGRLRFHASPNNFENPFIYYSTDHYGYSYTKYDEFNRIVEIGEQDPSFVSSNSQASFDLICASSVWLNDQNEPSANNSPTIIYDYDGVNAFSGAKNYTGRLTRVQYKDQNTSQWGYTWYSYNALGLVEWIKQRLPGQNSYLDRTISYTYDELGRLTKMAYDEGYSSTNDHFFWYYYDELGRLEKVTSYGSNLEGSALTEAEYTYYADGQIKQLMLGDGAQTVDYDYTIQGWLEAINNGTTSGSDQFGMILDYSNNGNIKEQEWEQAAFSTGTFNYFYDYDSANRLKEACFGSTYPCNSTPGNFDVIYDYDKNGNLDNIYRHGDGVEPNYEYALTLESGTNKVDYALVDGISGETQPVYKQLDYDANGNMIQNQVQGISVNGVGITSVTYDWRNLPTSVTANGSTLTYAYDADGNRVKKSLGSTTTWYVRGADGQVLAAYEGNTLLYLNILAGGQVIGQINN